MSFQDLWIAYFALGGASHPDEVRAYLAGQSTQFVDYDVVAQALNERFFDRGEDHPVPFLAELA
jgi:hypothetical protein